MHVAAASFKRSPLGPTRLGTSTSRAPQSEMMLFSMTTLLLVIATAENLQSVTVKFLRMTYDAPMVTHAFAPAWLASMDAVPPPS